MSRGEHNHSEVEHWSLKDMYGSWTERNKTLGNSENLYSAETPEWHRARNLVGDELWRVLNIVRIFFLLFKYVCIYIHNPHL
jgi:hypothetical protein